MRNLFTLLLLALFFQNLLANNYRVEISVFDRSVDLDYFYGINDVKLAVDVNELYRYYLGDFEDIARAESMKVEMIAKGYKYAKVVDMEKKRAACAMSCQAPIYVQNIFFDFDLANLRTKSRNDLDQLATLMADNPDYKVELSAHTDSHGSLEYNTNLSTRRATSAKDYLIAQGIASSRILTSEFGETSPIAKNNINGTDSPSGRQFNRRVVITVMRANGTIVPNIVRPIDIPSTLRVD